MEKADEKLLAASTSVEDLKGACAPAPASDGGVQISQLKCVAPVRTWSCKHQCFCSRSGNRATINEVACKIEGFILRQSPCPGPVETIPASFAPNFQPVQAADCREPFAVLFLRLNPILFVFHSGGHCRYTRPVTLMDARANRRAMTTDEFRLIFRLPVIAESLPRWECRG